MINYATLVNKTKNILYKIDIPNMYNIINAHVKKRENGKKYLNYGENKKRKKSLKGLLLI